MIRRLALAAATVALAVVVAGCNEEPEPKFDPDASLTPTGSPTTAPSSATSDAKPLTPVQTVRAWVRARNATVRTGDTKRVYELSSRNCTTCEDSVEPVAKVYERGGRYETFGWRVVRAKEDPDFRQNRTVAAGIEYAAGRTWRSKGAKPVSYDAEKHIVTFELVKENGQWLVDAIIYLS